MNKMIKQLTFKGQSFLNETSLVFYPEKNYRIALVYGNNGSGKSTIARAFKKAGGINCEQILYATCFDLDNKVIDFSALSEPNVFVYDEDYIRQNILINQAGLKTIIMFGKQVDLEQQIKVVQSAIENLNNQLEIKQSVYNQYTDVNNILSPDYYKTEIKVKLSGDTHWAGRERTILGNKVNSAVSFNKIQDIIEVKPDTSEEQTINEYKSTLQIYQDAKNGKGIISQEINCESEIVFNNENVQSLLKKKIENPELNDREKYLLTLVKSNHIDQVEKIKETFTNESIQCCPLCLRNVSKEYRESLVRDVEQILSHEVEEHKSALNVLKLQEEDFDGEPYKIIDSNLVQQIYTQQEDLNNEIIRLNQAIDNKYNNPYKQVFVKDFQISTLYVRLLASLKQLEFERLEYNKKFEDPNKLKQKLQNLNKVMAYYEILPSYKKYSKQNQEKVLIETDLNKIKQRLNDEKVKLDKLIQQKKSINIAVDLINHHLNYIFLSDKRMSIKAENGVYKLTSKGQNVKPEDVSSGERNIIALVYFFTQILENRMIGEEYKKPVFIVLDDPISSFDFENKIGILSFLRAVLSDVLKGNPMSQILILSHDLTTIINLRELFGDIKNELSINPKSSILKLFKLDNNQLKEISKKKLGDFNEYSVMMEKVYNYGFLQDDTDDLGIGNIMRRLLESFMTFTYKKGFSHIPSSVDILEVLPSNSYREYYKNLMVRFLLNGQSHMADRIKLTNDYEFPAEFSIDEKRKMAKSILCFMYMLNPLHVLHHLSNDKAKDNLEEWKKEIINNT